MYLVTDKETITHGFLLLARLMGQYCFGHWRLSSSVVASQPAAVAFLRGEAMLPRIWACLPGCPPLFIHYRSTT